MKELKLFWKTNSSQRILAIFKKYFLMKLHVLNGYGGFLQQQIQLTHQLSIPFFSVTTVLCSSCASCPVVSVVEFPALIPLMNPTSLCSDTAERST